MLELQHIHKMYNPGTINEICLFEDFNLKIEDGQFVSVVGSNGSGKTSMLNIICGSIPVDAGKILVNGVDISRQKDYIRHRRIGRVFQDPSKGTCPSMTILENLAIADNKGKAYGLGRGTNHARMDAYRELLASVGLGLEDKMHTKVGALSGGQRQRVGIARAIVKNPAIVIADEPTGNLDSKNTLEVMNIIKSISEEKLVILVTHEEQLADFYASRIIRIRDGKVISDELNEHADNLDYRIENKIYLKDIRDHKRLKTDHYNVDFYNESGGDLDLDIVIRNGNIYIRTNKPGDRIEIVNEDSSIEFVDDHYRKLSRRIPRKTALIRRNWRLQGCGSIIRY